MSRAPIRRLLLTAALLAAGLTRARAAWHEHVATEPGSGVAIDVDSPFDFSPSEGYLPLWVTVRNDSGAPRVWTIVCDDGGMPNRSADKHSSTASLRVENGQTVRLPMLMAMDNDRYSYYYHTNQVRIDGFGVSDAQVPTPAGNATSKSTSSKAVVGMSEALATPIWTGLTKYYEDRVQNLRGTPVDLGLLGSDWRALVSLDSLWITDADYAALDATRRATVHDWVSQGGHLYVCAQSPDPALRAGVGLSATGDEADAGLGHVSLIPWDGKPPPLNAVAGLIDASAPLRGSTPSDTATGWPITRAVGRIPLNAPFLIAFIVLFALLVGPINLFVFARAARRHRLFWTTPLISVAASAMLAGVIVLQDGFGGHGSRVLFCLLLPDEKKAVVWQEQVARTGILLARQFHVGEDLVLSPLQVESSGGKRSFAQTGRNYEGDWFTTRSVQAQRAEAVVPTRAGVQLVNAEAAKGGAPPVFTSSVPATIKEIWYYDPSGGRWRGDNLRTGERITLARFETPTPTPLPAASTASQAQEGHFSLPSTGGSSLLDNCQERCLNTRGYFVAYADEGPFFETLPSIRWTGQRAVFAGPVATAP